MLTLQDGQGSNTLTADVPFASPSTETALSDDNDAPENPYKRRKVEWANNEDLFILSAVRTLGTQWPKIASQLHNRTPDAVRNRWHRLQKAHAFDAPDSCQQRTDAADALLCAAGAPAPGGKIKGDCIRGSDHGRTMWSSREDEIIESGVKQFGCKWRQIAKLLEGRSDSSIRNRWMRILKEREAAAFKPPAQPHREPPAPLFKIAASVPNGQLVQLPVGQPPVGVPVVQVPVGQAPIGQAPVGQAPVGQATNVHPGGWIPMPPQQSFVGNPSAVYLPNAVTMAGPMWFRPPPAKTPPPAKLMRQSSASDANVLAGVRAAPEAESC